MQYRTLGKTGLRVSEVTLGGGGIGMVWGETTEEECLETVKDAVAAGINSIDVAPVYGKGKAEEIVGRVLPELSQRPLIATKVFIQPQERTDLAGAIRRSLEASLSRLGCDRVDIFQLHNQVEPEEPSVPFRLSLQELRRPNGVLDTLQQLKDEGLVGAIGFTGIARHDVIQDLLSEDRLETVQLVTNILNSEGEMGAAGDAVYRDHLEMLRTAQANELGVFGIRPFAAGSLTDAVDRSLSDDHPVATDFALAHQQLGFLTGQDSLAVAAMRYALSLPGVSTVVTGAKNRAELAEAIAATQAGPLAAEVMEQIAELQRTVLKRTV
jgi:aryl-alcohol dehydrogenase-like predicted oxidoreductase